MKVVKSGRVNLVVLEDVPNGHLFEPTRNGRGCGLYYIKPVHGISKKTNSGRYDIFKCACVVHGDFDSFPVDAKVIHYPDAKIQTGDPA